ncbi:MAG: hypothetical protein CL912_17520 [Deltaproteobacteria bacterium]|nr:hypothetical protein [Deltaproteobacteria bacterium]|tara:strand:+ start:297 stop:539 length:243 start_codon:yes stop_codon:yes gene_type:complete
MDKGAEMWVISRHAIIQASIRSSSFSCGCLLEDAEPPIEQHLMEIKAPEPDSGLFLVDGWHNIASLETFVTLSFLQLAGC